MPEEVLKRLEEKTKLTKEEEELLEAARKKTNVENKVSLQSRNSLSDFLARCTMNAFLTGHTCMYCIEGEFTYCAELSN